MGWAFLPTPDADLVIMALDMAYERRGRPNNVLVHSDQGSKGVELSARGCGDIALHKA